METVVDLSFTVQCYVSMVYAVTFLCVYHATDLHQKSRIELFFVMKATLDHDIMTLWCKGFGSPK